MGREASRDQGELAARRIVHREMAAGALGRGYLGGRMVGALLAEIRMGGRAHARGHPHPSLLVHHLIVDAGLAVPDRLGSPIWGGGGGGWLGGGGGGGGA